VIRALDRYWEAMEARSIEQLTDVLAPDVVVLEGTHKNVGWEDYRHDHIGPEMRGWKRFRVSDPTVVKLVRAEALALVVEEATSEVETASARLRLRVAQTFVLERGPEGWRIQHLHVSAKSLPVDPGKGGLG
jgi:ketosteroid isomerase-like protein